MKPINLNKIVTITLLIIAIPLAQAYGSVAEFGGSLVPNFVNPAALQNEPLWKDIPAVLSVDVTYDPAAADQAMEIVTDIDTILNPTGPAIERAVASSEFEAVEDLIYETTGDDLSLNQHRRSHKTRDVVLVTSGILLLTGLIILLLAMFGSGSGSAAGSFGGASGAMFNGGDGSGSGSGGDVGGSGTPSGSGGPAGDGSGNNGGAAGGGAGGGLGAGAGGGIGGGVGGGGGLGDGGLSGGGLGGGTGGLPLGGSIPHNPEPSSLIMLGFGLLLPFLKRKKS